MDWNEFFEKTRLAAGAESFSKLAPMLGITDGAIGHYRQGRRVPQVWTVADALRIQGHPEPEKAAIQIMKQAALTSTERTFWKRLAATAAGMLLAIGITMPSITNANNSIAQKAFRSYHLSEVQNTSKNRGNYCEITAFSSFGAFSHQKPRKISNLTCCCK